MHVLNTHACHPSPYKLVYIVLNVKDGIESEYPLNVFLYSKRIYNDNGILRLFCSSQIYQIKICKTAFKLKQTPTETKIDKTETPLEQPLISWKDANFHHSITRE